MKGLRNYINSVKPNFVGEGKYSKWFPLFDAIENFVFSTQTKTTNPVHVRDGVDIQKIMVIVWLSTFPIPTNPSIKVMKKAISLSEDLLLLFFLKKTKFVCPKI